MGIGVLSNPGVAFTLLLSGGYSLYRQTPYTFEAAWRLTGAYPSNSPNSRAEDLLSVAGYGLGLLGFAVGANAFIQGGKAYSGYLSQLESKGVPNLLARQIAWKKADSLRRAVQDPEIWVLFARSSPELSESRRLLYSRLGKFTNHALLEGSAVVGVGQLGVGLEKMYEKSKRGEDVKAKEVFSLLLNTASQVSPGVTMLLYRWGRGNRGSNLGPILAHELSDAFYRDPKNTTWDHREVERGIPFLSVDQEKIFMQQGHQDLLNAERMAEELRPLEPPKPTQPAAPGSSFLIPQRILSTPASSKPNAVPFTKPEDWSRISIEDFHRFYSDGSLKPSDVWRIILQHPSTKNGAIFPRTLDEGLLGWRLNRLVKESDRRFANGNPRPLEGIFVAVKDLFPGVDGVMNLGSKTARVTGVGKAPLVDILLEMGAIPLPVGLVAAANGGSGEHAAWGYIPHPVREGFDPAGSSSGTAYVVGKKDLPVNVGIGTDIGGSVTAPAGACMFGFVPPRGLISTYNMVSSAIFLERVGVLAQSSKDGMMLGRILSRNFGADPHQKFQNPGMLYQAAPQKPVIVYLEEPLAPTPSGSEPKFSPESVANFQRQMNLYRRMGFEVIGLDSRWNVISEVPFLLYPYDAYAASTFTHTNPLQRNPFQPPRVTLDSNLYLRLPKGDISVRFGLFERARSLSVLLESLIMEKLGSGYVIASPSVEALPTQEIQNGKAGPKWDNHDRVSMLKNRVDAFGQINLPTANWKGRHVGITFTGPLPELMHFVDSKP
jgi:Asp-tRNA(Asn)/Glu-tRNA(Gln) amidotransferase A subunit family amidase